MKKIYNLFIIIFFFLTYHGVSAKVSFGDLNIVSTPNGLYADEILALCGDKNIEKLPYTHSDNTETYGNNYSGLPGNNCGVGAKYLNGSEVIYTYTATKDDLISIKLTDLNAYYAGVFIYESCGQIGVECLDSVVAGPSINDLVIQDFPVMNGKTYYIVVSSWLIADIDYTIHVNSFICSDFEEPLGETTQYFIPGDTVSDLKVEETRSEGVFKWYEDAALNIEITDISTHALVNNSVYYVTQTFNECESPALAITTEEVDCSNLKIVNYTDAEVICRGSMTLKAQGSGSGDEIYWYENPRKDKIVAKGGTFTTPELTQTTSFWAAEVRLIGERAVCESPLQEVVATVKQSGNIKHIDLPYVDTNSTSIFGNNFSGDAGDGCDGKNYLNGNDATYYFTADPNNDDILQIELSDFTIPNAAVFVYHSCGDIGVNCLAGARNDGGTILIEDLYVEAGEDLIIVVSSSSGFTDYTLKISGVECDNVPAPMGNNTPIFVDGNMIDDLEISGSPYNEGFVWYSDAALTNRIKDPSMEPIQNGQTYYVTQSLLGCESGAFELTPIEFDCSIMDIELKESTYYVCAPGGQVRIPISSSGTGSEVYWYNKKNGGTIVGVGNELVANITEPTSFWVSEVFSEKFIDSNEPLPNYCMATFTTGCALENYIDNFILKDSSGNLLINHLGTGCSLNAYGDFTDDKALTATLIAGETYSFEITHPGTINFAQIWIDYNGNGSFEDAGEFAFNSVKIGTTINPTLGTFRVPYDIKSGTSVMRVRNTYIYSPDNSDPCTQMLDFGEVHDYKVLLIGPEWGVACESPRKEIKVMVNENVTPPPIATRQSVCGEQMLSEISVLGTDIKWYDAYGTELSRNSIIEKGQKYYVTQTINACESNLRELILQFIEKSEKPIASINQTYEEGDDLNSLEVYGDNLTWYSDKRKENQIPGTTILQNQAIYYVTQTVDGECESNPLSITVHKKTLDVKDVWFNTFEFYPNPVSGILFISNEEIIDKIEIYDLAGRKIYANKYNRSSMKIDLTEFTIGTYLIKATVNNKEKIFRVIKI